MGPFEVKFATQADRQLRRLERPVQQRLSRAIDSLRVDPRPPGAKRLVTAEQLWRVRVGAYRIVYAIEDDRLLILVVKIGPRRDVYRGL